MDLIGKPELISKVKEAKAFKFSVDDYNQLIDKKILIDFEPPEGSYPLAISLDLACQVIEPTVLTFPDQSDRDGTEMWNYRHSERLGKCQLLRFDERMGLFVNLDECPSYLVQLIIQELSPRRLQRHIIDMPDKQKCNLKIIKGKIGQFAISVILPDFYQGIANHIIKNISDAFIPAVRTMVTFWFHGAKNQSLGPILTTLCYVARPHDAVIDMFSGSCAVAAKLAYYRPTITNDSEAFSAEIARALMAKFDADILNNVLNILYNYFEENKKSLTGILGPHLEEEEWLVWGPITQSSLDEYQALVDQYPIYSNDRFRWKLPENECVPWKRALEDIEARRKDRKLFPYCLLTYYFGNAYFGLRQAIELDSIRYSIDCFADRYCTTEEKEGVRSLLIAGLLSVASTMSSGPGHFAEYQRSFSKGNTRKIWTKRREKIAWDLFCERVRYFSNEHPPFLLKAFNEDWYAALNQCLGLTEGKTCYMPTTVYADPPMSDFQYSRFYHVLKTICLYDYPESHGRGLYRKDRFYSRFSSRSKAFKEMDWFIKSASHLKKRLVLSYKPYGIIPLHKVYSLMNTYYNDVLVLSYQVVHSSQGRQRSRTQATTSEVIFVGRPGSLVSETDDRE